MAPRLGRRRGGGSGGLTGGGTGVAAVGGGSSSSQPPTGGLPSGEARPTGVAHRRPVGGSVVGRSAATTTGSALAIGAAAGVSPVTSSTITVMLSRPPASLASSTSVVGRLLGVGGAGEHGADLAVVDLVEQAVGADEVAVAGAGRRLPGVDLDVGLDAEGPGHDVALRMEAGLVGGDLARRHQVLHVGVVAGDLLEDAVLHDVGAGVADVHDGEALLAVALDEGDAGERGAHAVEVGLGQGALVDGGVGVAHGLDEGLGGVGLGPRSAPPAW